MSKPLPSQNTFAALSPPWSLVSLDANFTNVWAAIDDVGTYSNVFADTGAVNAMVVAVTAPLTFSLVDGVTLDVKVGNTTTSNAPTLNVAGTGAKTIVNADNTILAIGQLPANMRVRFVYDLANTVWRITSITAGVSNWVIGPPATGVALTVNGPNAPAPTSIQFNLNGNGTGNDVDIAGPFNGTNEFFLRATSAGASAKAILAAADVNSLGLILAAAGSGFTGTLSTGGPSGRGAAIQTNYAGPLSLGTNTNANMIFGSTAAAVGNDISARGVYLARFKSADTSTTSSTALTNDPDLTIALGIGTFYFRFAMIVTTTAGGSTPGLRFGVNYSGTNTTGAEFFYGFNGASVTGTGAANTTIAGVVAYNNNLGTTSLFIFEGTITVTTAGTFALGWGQSVSSATATVMKAGSTMQVTQIN